MNIVYYLNSSKLKDKGISVSGGHGYTYDPLKESKRKLVKDTPSCYGYFVNGTLQSIAVEQVEILSGRTLRQENEYDAFLTHLNELLGYAKRVNAEKVLIITNSINGVKLCTTPKLTEKFANNELVNKVRALVKEFGNNVMFDNELWALGGEGAKQSCKQLDLATALLELQNCQEASLDVCTVKEFKDPENDFNRLVTATRWFFNTGDKSTFYQYDKYGYRQYCFGRVEPQKQYYGKATPDVYYSALFTKEPITILDKLYNFCQANKPNPYNLIAAAKIDLIKSKEISRVIDVLPGTIGKNSLTASMSVAGVDDPILVDFIDPPGLCYRIRDFHHVLSRYHEFFRERDEQGIFKCHKFIDITDRFFEKDQKDKWKLASNFTMNTLTIPIAIQAPGCVKDVTINLAIKYDTPERSALNSIIKEKNAEFKVYLGLDFQDEAGVVYYTIVDTPGYTYIHANSCSNLRVYSLKELGRK